MKYIIEVRNIWELGQRANQEDSIYPQLDAITESNRTFVVCDGMGGHDAGEVASQTVCRTLFEACKKKDDKFTEDDFNEALAKAYDALDEKDTGAEKKMGTTMTFLKLHDNGYFIAHIGDSRVYHIRPGKDEEDTEIIFQTRDHSLVNDLIKIGELTPEEAKYSKQKNVITRAMQPNMERRARAEIKEYADVKEGDYFFLCTDGVLEQMEDENIRFIFSEKCGDIDSKKKMLMDVTADNRDNHSAILVFVKSITSVEVENCQNTSSVDKPMEIDCLEFKEKEVEENHKIEESNTPIKAVPLPQKNVCKKTLLPSILCFLLMGGIIILIVYLFYELGWLHWISNIVDACEKGDSLGVKQMILKNN